MISPSNTMRDQEEVAAGRPEGGFKSTSVQRSLFPPN